MTEYFLHKLNIHSELLKGSMHSLEILAFYESDGFKVQWLAKKLVIWSINLINLVFLSKVFELCHPHNQLAPNSVRLEASKKVLLVHMPQWAAKLQAVKLFSFFKNCTFLFISHIII